MESKKIIAIKYAESSLPESAVFQNGTTDRRVPITFVAYGVGARSTRQQLRGSLSLPCLTA